MKWLHLRVVLFKDKCCSVFCCDCKCDKVFVNAGALRDEWNSVCVLAGEGGMRGRRVAGEMWEGGMAQ